jgi:hypothetical protein
VNILDIRGNSAFDEANKASMWECAYYLWRHGANVKCGKKRSSTSSLSLTRSFFELFLNEIVLLFWVLTDMGLLLWKRPRVAGTPPSARYNAACCSYFSSLV